MFPGTFTTKVWQEETKLSTSLHLCIFQRHIFYNTLFGCKIGMTMTILFPAILRLSTVFIIMYPPTPALLMGAGFRHIRTMQIDIPDTRFDSNVGGWGKERVNKIWHEVLAIQFACLPSPSPCQQKFKCPLFLSAFLGVYPFLPFSPVLKFDTLTWK